MSALIKLSQQEYGLISGLVYDKFGIHLGDRKQALVVGRLNKIVKQNGFSTYKDYYKYIIADQSGEGLNTLINRLSTNHTYFFREKVHLNFFSNTLLPLLKQTYADDQAIRVWSCGCSSGEEAYALAMLMLEFFWEDIKHWKTAVLGIDISEQALNRAIEGKYSKENISGIPVALKHKYFQLGLDGSYQAKKVLKDIVLFRRLNLKRNHFPFKKKFHAVFCKNVMIYFDQQTRDNLLQKMAAVIEENGYLFIGLSESIKRTNKYFKYVQPGVYRRLG